MAKYVLSLPVILFPYTLLFALCCLYTGFLMEPVFQNNGYLLLLALALCFVVAAVFAVIVAVGAIATLVPEVEIVSRPNSSIS